MPRDEHKRSDRVAERIRAELMDLLLRGAVRDPRVSGVLVSNVRVSDDLSSARVYIRTLEQADRRRQEAAVQGLESAAGYIRREIGARMKLRYTPNLRFYWDDVVDSAMRIEGILDEIRQDQPDGDGEPETPEGADG